MNKNKIKKMAVLLNETLYPILKEGIRNKVSKEDGLNIAVALLNNLDENQGIDKLMKEACENTNNMIKENFLLSVHHASNIKENLFRENVLEVVKAVKADRVEDIVTERFEALKNINLAHAPEEGDELTPDVGTGDADDQTTVDGLGEDFSGNADAMEEELGIDGFETEDEGVTGEAGDFDEMGLGGDSADIFGTDSTAGDDGEFSFEGEGGETGEGDSGEDFSFSDEGSEEDAPDTEEATEEEIHKESIRRFRESVVYLKNVKSLAGGNTQAMVSTIEANATEEGSEVVASVATDSAEGKVTSIVKTAINTIQTYLQSSNTKDLDIIGELTLVAKLLGHAINNVMEEGVNNLYASERGILKTAMDEIDGVGAKYSIARGYLGLYTQILEEKIGIDEDVVFNNAAENHIVQASPVGGDIAVSYVIAETDNFHKNAGEEEGLVSIDDVVATKESFKSYLNDELSYMGEGAPVELRNLIGQILLAVDVSTEEILSAIIVSFGNVINYTTEERKALREIVLTTLTYCHVTGRGLDTLLEGDNEVATKIMSVLYLTVTPSEDAIVAEAPMGDSDTVQKTNIPTDKLEDIVDDAIETDANETNLIKEAATYKIDPNLVTYEEIEGMVNTLEANPKAFYTDEELKTYGTELNGIYGKVISGGQPIFKKLKALDFGRRCVDMLKPSSKLSDAIQTRLSSGKNPVTRLSSLTDDVLKYASRSGLIALSMLAPVAGLAVATFAIISRMLSQRERETTRKVINHEIAKLNVAKSMAKDKEVEEYLDTIISHYTKILQYVEGNYNANKEISGIRKAVESLLKRNRKDGKKIIKESRLNRLVAKESATQIYRECCLSSTLGNYESIFKGIVEAVLKGELEGRESIEAVTNSLTDATKSYIRLVEYKLSLEPNEEANSLVIKLVDLLSKEGVGQNDFANFILSDMTLTSEASTYRGLLAIPFAYLAMFVTAEEGVTVDRHIIAQHLADLEYLDTSKAYAVQIIASLAGNENALKYNSFDLYNLESAKSETSEVAQSDLYEEANTTSGHLKNVAVDPIYLKDLENISDDMMQAVKDISEGKIEPYKLGSRVMAKLNRLKEIIESGESANNVGVVTNLNRHGFRDAGVTEYIKRFITGALPIIDVIRTKKSMDAETEKKLLNLVDPLLSEAGFFGTLTAIGAGSKAMAYGRGAGTGYLNKKSIVGMAGTLVLFTLIFAKGAASKKRLESYHRVLPKLIIKVKALTKSKELNDADRAAYELILLHLYTVSGYILEDESILEEIKEEYGADSLVMMDKVVTKKFKELTALANVGDKFKEAYNGFNMINDRNAVELVEESMATSSEIIKIINDNAKGIDTSNKLSAMTRDKLKKLQYHLDNARTGSPEGHGFTYSKKAGADYSGTAKYRWKRFIQEMLPIINIFKTDAQIDAETEKRLLALATVDPAGYGTKGKNTGAFLSYAAFMIPLIPFAYMSAKNEKRVNQSTYRVVPKVIVKSKLVIDNPSTPKEEKIMHELFIMHTMMMFGAALATDKTAKDMIKEYGVSEISDLEGVINKKFKELKALASANTFKEAPRYKEAPHAMGEITVNKQLRSIKKLNNETIEMLKDIAAGNVDKYRLDEKLKGQLKKFYNNAAYLDGEIKGTALITGLGPKFEKPVSKFSKKLLEFIGGAFPIIDAFRSQASIEKEIESRIMGMINPIQSLARNMGTLSAGTSGMVLHHVATEPMAKDINRLVQNTPMKNPVLTGLGLLNAGALMLFIVGSFASTKKRRKGLLNVCERLEYKFKALSKAKKIPKEEKDIYELMLMHIMLVHKYIDPEQYSSKGLPEYAINLEDEINDKFDEIIKSVGIEKSFKEAAGVSVRLMRENRVLSKLAKLNGFRESVAGDIEYIGDGATEAILDILELDTDKEPVEEVQPTEDVIGDTFENVTEVVVEEPSEPVAMVATTITENMVDESVGEVYSETAKASFVSTLDYVDAEGNVSEGDIIEGIKKVKNSIADKLQAKHTKQYVALVEEVGRDVMGESRVDMNNIGLDTLLSASPRATGVRQAYYGALTEKLVDKFGGVLHTDGSFEYACLLAFNTPIRMATLNKRMAHDKNAVTRVIADALAGIDAYINDTLGGSRFKNLSSAKKNILTDVRSTIAQGVTASTFKEGVDRDFSPAIAAISTYAIGLDTLLNEKGNTKEFIASMLRK